MAAGEHGSPAGTACLKGGAAAEYGARGLCWQLWIQAPPLYAGPGCSYPEAVAALVDRQLLHATLLAGQQLTHASSQLRSATMAEMR